jgi:hypothetical protein
VSWNVKFQESNEWKSKVTSDDDSDEEEFDEDEEDLDDEEVDEDEEDSDNEEVDEDKVCSRTKKVIPSQDQPHYHILMVDDSDESNPQFQLNVPEGN